MLAQDHHSKPRGSGACWPRITTQNPEDQGPLGPESRVWDRATKAKRGAWAEAREHHLAAYWTAPAYGG